MNQILLLEIACRHCHCLFDVCRSCYQGQRYCGAACRIEAQGQAHREAQRKYRRTAKGKEVHRKAEQLRRLKGKNRHKDQNRQIKVKTVADESTTTSCCQTKLHPYLPNRQPQCHFCGVYGVVVSRFADRGYGSRRQVHEKPFEPTGSIW